MQEEFDYKKIGWTLLAGELEQDGHNWNLSDPHYWDEGIEPKPRPWGMLTRNYQEQVVGRKMASITIDRIDSPRWKTEVKFTFYVDTWELRDVTVSKISSWGDSIVSSHDQDGNFTGPDHSHILPQDQAQQILQEVRQIFNPPGSGNGEVY